jgi:hypothetical protein
MSLAMASAAAPSAVAAAAAAARPRAAASTKRVACAARPSTQSRSRRAPAAPVAAVAEPGVVTPPLYPNDFAPELDLPLSDLTAISPLDGRAGRESESRPFCLIRLVSDTAHPSNRVASTTHHTQSPLHAHTVCPVLCFAVHCRITLFHDRAGRDSLLIPFLCTLESDLFDKTTAQ